MYMILLINTRTYSLIVEFSLRPVVSFFSFLSWLVAASPKSQLMMAASFEQGSDPLV